MHGGYVPADRLAPLLASHDVLALTYRSATASQNALLGQQHGLPVLASDVGTFGGQVRDGVDGLLVPPGDKAALVGGAAAASPSPRIADAAARPGAPPGPVRPVGALRRDHRGAGGGRARRRAGRGTRPEPPPARPPSPVTCAHRIASTVRAVVAASRPEVELGRGDLPDWVRASDILADGQDADDAKAFARSLGLPRCSDGIAAWAALGALAAIVRVATTAAAAPSSSTSPGSRSPLSRWARAIGFAPVELELTGHRS